MAHASMVRNRLRVVVATGIYPPDIGGPATHAWELCSEWLREDDVEVSVATLHDVGQERPHEPWPVTSVPRRGPLLVQLLKRFAMLVRASLRADVVYATGLQFEAAVATVVSRRTLVVKVVGDPVWERARRLGWTHLEFDAFQQARFVNVRVSLMRLARRLWLRRASTVVVPSRYIGEVVKGWKVDPRRIAVVYNGHHNRYVAPVDSPSASGARVLYVGRLIAHKRVDILLRAAAELGYVSLEVVGDGPAREELQAAAVRLGLVETVAFHGAVLPERVAEYLRAAHVVVNAAEYEGLPHTLVEALGMGRPVIATAAGGTGEIVRTGENGWLLPLSCAEADVVRALREISEMGDSYVDLCQRAASSVARLSVATMAREIEEVLRRAGTA